MENDNIREFLIFYNFILERLSKKNDMYKISIYYLNNEFNINIKSLDEKNFYNEHFKTTIFEYNYLLSMIGYSFIENHKITLPFFESIYGNDYKIYYSKSNTKPLDYEIAKVHILRNSKFELKMYYFNGLNKLSYDIQDKALQKLNQKILKMN